MMVSLVKAFPRRFHLVFLLLFGFTFSNTHLFGQVGSAKSGPPAHHYLGLDLGLGALPSSILGLCSGYSAEEGGPDASMFGGIFAGLPIGSFHLEQRTHYRFGSIGQVCPTSLEVFESGIHTNYITLVDEVPKSSSELRIGYGLPFQPSLVASVGAGWLWGTGVPYLSSDLGIRTTGRSRFTVDLGWESYRIPFRLTEEEWEDLQLVRVVGEKKKHYWQRGWSIQVGWATYIR